jgi:hypothetical protein
MMMKWLTILGFLGALGCSATRDSAPVEPPNHALTAPQRANESKRCLIDAECPRGHRCESSAVRPAVEARGMCVAHRDADPVDEET